MKFSSTISVIVILAVVAARLTEAKLPKSESEVNDKQNSLANSNASNKKTKGNETSGTNHSQSKAEAPPFSSKKASFPELSPEIITGNSTGEAFGTPPENGSHASGGGFSIGNMDENTLIRYYGLPPKWMFWVSNRQWWKFKDLRDKARVKKNHLKKTLLHLVGKKTEDEKFEEEYLKKVQGTKGPGIGHEIPWQKTTKLSGVAEVAFSVTWIVQNFANQIKTLLPQPIQDFWSGYVGLFSGLQTQSSLQPIGIADTSYDQINSDVEGSQMQFT